MSYMILGYYNSGGKNLIRLNGVPHPPHIHKSKTHNVVVNVCLFPNKMVIIRVTFEPNPVSGDGDDDDNDDDDDMDFSENIFFVLFCLICCLIVVCFISFLWQKITANKWKFCEVHFMSDSTICGKLHSVF